MNVSFFFVFEALVCGCGKNEQKKGLKRSMYMPWMVEVRDMLPKDARRLVEDGVAVWVRDRITKMIRRVRRDDHGV